MFSFSWFVDGDSLSGDDIDVNPPRPPPGGSQSISTFDVTRGARSSTPVTVEGEGIGYNSPSPGEMADCERPDPQGRLVLTTPPSTVSPTSCKEGWLSLLKPFVPSCHFRSLRRCNEGC